MVGPLQEITGLEVSLEEVAYSPKVHSTPDRPHAFVYRIAIRNTSSEPVTLRGRKWVVTSRTGKDSAVTEGDGVDGEFPHLEPGEEFRYSGYHLVAGDSQAAGAYLVVRGDGAPYIARIPSFEMRVPRKTKAA